MPQPANDLRRPSRKYEDAWDNEVRETPMMRKVLEIIAALLIGLVVTFIIWQGAGYLSADWGP